MKDCSRLTFLRFSFADAERLIARINRRGFRAQCVRISKGRIMVTVAQ